MRVFHRTPVGQKIINEGFRDAEDCYLTDSLHRGVWLSDIPLSVCEGAKGKDLLTLEIPDDVLAEYEWVQEGPAYREFLIPAEVVNSYGPPELCDEDGIDWMWPSCEEPETDQ